MVTNQKNQQLNERNGLFRIPQKTKRLSILVVEDSTSARMKIVSSLELLDVNLLEADDGTTALQILEDKNQQVDIVLTDLNMKTMHGDELCSIIRNRLNLRELPVIVLSARIDKKTTINLFKTGATDFLYKPFTSEELVARINIHLERQQLNKVLVEQIAQLKDLNKIKDDLLAVCSHDFRSPLQIIMGYTEVMLNDSSTTKNNKNMLESIKTSSDNLLEMIDQILVLGQAEKLSGKVGISAQPVKKIIRSCVTNFYTIASNKKISLNYSDIEENPLVNGNQNELTRIFNNLLSNAIKFTPSGGTVSVKLEIDTGKTLVTSISDTGVGIPEENLPLLFEKYSSISHEGTGGEKTTGLGLYITKELIHNYQGEIEVKSEVDKGSCFIVKLPVLDKTYGLMDMKFDEK